MLQHLYVPAGAQTNMFPPKLRLNLEICVKFSFQIDLNDSYLIYLLYYFYLFN